MADPSPPAGLLDRAGRVFSLAAQLGRAFQNEHEAQRRAHRIDSSAWGRLRSGFDEFCAAVLELQGAMQNPPAGFAPVAEVLLEAARVARQIRATTQNAECFAQATYLDFFLHFNSVAASGEGSISGLMKARRSADPFAFLDEPVADNASGIDTTPIVPKPPEPLIEAAERHIPHVFSNLQPNHEGSIEMPAATLGVQLQKASHTLAAAQWAIHEAVRAGRLSTGRVEEHLPTIIRPQGNGLPAALFPNRNNWHEAERPARGMKPIPKGKPAPFDCFKVVATEALWQWWRSLDTANPREDEPSADASRENEPASADKHTPGVKRSTERGEGRAKLIAALSRHHRYAVGGAASAEPINNNELARQAEVSVSTASAFFDREFKGHAEYKAVCRRNTSGLVLVLRKLNDELPGHVLLYGRRPGDEDDRTGDE